MHGQAVAHADPLTGPGGRQAAADPAGPAGQRSWALLILLCVAEFMVILDMTVVNVALPSIGRALRFSAAGLPWVVTAYVLCTGGLMLLGGRSADLLGRRRVFRAGLILFTAASLASGLAPNAGVLLASRAAQGAGAALLTPAALAIITAAYTGRQRTTALTVWGALAGGGAAAGVLLGGLLTSGFGWRSVFLINVPVGLAAGLASRWLLPPAGVDRGRAGGHASHADLDLPGALLVVTGLVALVYGFTGAQLHGWLPARTWLPLAVAALLFTAAALVERSTARPLIPPATWRVTSLVAGAAMMFGATSILAGSFFLTSLYLQDSLGASPVVAGLEFLPLMLVIGLAGQLSAHLIAPAGAKVLAVAGLVLMTGGALLLASPPAGAGYATGVLPGLLVLGSGIGLVLPAASVSAMSEVANGQEGLASGLMTTVHEVGAALGVALFSAVAALGTAGPVAGAHFLAGYRHGFEVAAVLAGCLALAALLVVRPARPAEDAHPGFH